MTLQFDFTWTMYKLSLISLSKKWWTNTFGFTVNVISSSPIIIGIILSKSKKNPENRRIRTDLLGARCFSAYGSSSLVPWFLTSKFSRLSCSKYIKIKLKFRAHQLILLFYIYHFHNEGWCFLQQFFFFQALQGSHPS